MQTVRIERLGAQGDGISAEGVFAPFSLPDETLAGEVVDGRIARPTITDPSPDRTTPPCPHFGTCGGCALQHASDSFIATWKRGQIASALAARGITGVEIRDTVTSPPRSRRRATFAARRTKKTVQVGFRGRGSEEVITLNECHLVDHALLIALPAIEAAAMLGASRKGVIRGTATLSVGGIDLAIEDAKPLERQGIIAAAALAERHDLARLTWNGEITAARRSAAQRFGTAEVTPPPGGFLQATREGEATLVAAATEALGKATRIADLFAGCGTFTLPLATSAEVHAVEGAKALTDALDAGWRRAVGVKKVTTEARDLFRRPLLSTELAAFDGVVIDPPRAGAAAQMEHLATHGPTRIASISCNPATFARDARTLIDGGYRLDWVLPVDQFRWSPHVEIAARFSR
ncbi:MAG: class I SAM-dependent RNA methyltransferase [Pseudomonadota bacterium]